MMQNLAENVVQFITGGPSYARDTPPLDLDLFPDVVLQEIFKRADYPTLRNLKKVNHRFQALLSDPLLWISMCLEAGRTLPPLAFRRSLASFRLEEIEENYGESPEIDYERVYAKDPFRPNLAPPLLASIQQMKDEYGWKFDHTGYGSQMEVVDLEGEEPVRRCIVTSHSWGKRLVEINLVKEGVPEWILDHVRPRIVVSEWTRPRHDCASIYKMYAQLLKEHELFDTRVVLPRFKVAEKEWPQWTHTDFEKVELVFEDYPIGMRSIAILSQGKDQQFWAGFYGARFGNLEVRIELPDDVRWLTAEMFTEPEKSLNNDEPPFMRHRNVVGRRFGGIFGRFH